MSLYQTVINKDGVWAKVKKSGARVDILYGFKHSQRSHGHIVYLSGSQIHQRGISGLSLISGQTSSEPLSISGQSFIMPIVGIS